MARSSKVSHREHLGVHRKHARWIVNAAANSLVECQKCNFPPPVRQNRGDSLGFDFWWSCNRRPLACHASGQSRTGGCDREGKSCKRLINFLLPQIFLGGWRSGRVQNTPRAIIQGPKIFKSIQPRSVFPRVPSSLPRATWLNTPPRRGGRLLWQYLYT